MNDFITEALVDEDSFCNFKSDILTLEKAVTRGEKIALYGPRNYGKTSLVKNIIAQRFKQRHKRCFVFFVDLMELKNLEALDQRMSRYFESSFVESFPVKSILDHIKQFLTSLKPELQIDSLTGQPSLQLGVHPGKQARTTQAIFKTIQEISKKIPTLIILDEFQDIAFIKGAQAEFRTAFQNLNQLPIIVLGSKRHLLTQILAAESAPLAFWGKDLELKPIAYETYHAYIMERFKPRKIRMELEASRYLQDKMFRIPESVNTLCLQLIEQFPHQVITQEKINLALVKLVDQKASRYGSYCGQFSDIEERVLTATAKLDYVAKPQSKDFIKLASTTARTSGLVFKKLLNKGVLEKDPQGYRLSDPLFYYFLRTYR